MSRRNEYHRKDISGEGEPAEQNRQRTEEQAAGGEKGSGRSYIRSASGRHVNSNRQAGSNRSYFSRYNRRITEEETVEDIKMDISRIEKEIKLEIKEIRSIKL